MDYANRPDLHPRALAIHRVIGKLTATLTVRKSKKIASPGCRANRRISNAPGPASMSGSSARLPSGNQRASFGQERAGISHGPRCEPASSSRLPPSGARVDAGDPEALRRSTAAERCCPLIARASRDLPPG
jgi:hypothetical protein